jgi:hypothetical protein
MWEKKRCAGPGYYFYVNQRLMSLPAQHTRQDVETALLGIRQELASGQVNWP